MADRAGGVVDRDPTPVLLTAANSFAPYAAAGGHRLKLCLYGAVMMIIAGIALIVVPHMVQALFQNVASAPTTVMVTVVDDGAISAPSPTATGFPGTATAAGSPVAVTTVDLNVREGPTQDYPILDLLSVGTEVQISGKSPDGTWWRIVYPLEGGGHGWVYAPFTRSSNAEDVPVVQTPVPPTETSTPTVAPTNTATPSPSLTNTPAPAVTLTPHLGEP